MEIKHGRTGNMPRESIRIEASAMIVSTGYAAAVFHIQSKAEIDAIKKALDEIGQTFTEGAERMTPEEQITKIRGLLDQYYNTFIKVNPEAYLDRIKDIVGGVETRH